MTIWRVALIGAIALGGIVWAIATARGQEIDRGAYFKSLRQPKTNYSCCDISDCKQLDDDSAEYREGQWWAVVDDEWTPIPQEKVLTDKMPLEGRAVVCSSPTRRIYCFVRPLMGG